jgi:hypothetical protein
MLYKTFTLSDVRNYEGFFELCIGDQWSIPITRMVRTEVVFITRFVAIVFIRRFFARTEVVFFRRFVAIVFVVVFVEGLLSCGLAISRRYTNTDGTD